MAILVAIACTHDKNIYTEPQERIAYCEAFENYEVPVKAGYTTIVTEGDDTLAVVNEPTTIKIPKGSILPSRGESGIKVDFAILNNVDTYSQYWQAVMFEDTEYGDYDYNDLVIHVRMSSATAVRNGIYTIYISSRLPSAAEKPSNWAVYYRTIPNTLLRKMSEPICSMEPKDLSIR